MPPNVVVREVIGIYTFILFIDRKCYRMLVKADDTVVDRFNLGCDLEEAMLDYNAEKSYRTGMAVI